jgi:hypothetical protein
MPTAKKSDPTAGVAEDAESILNRLRNMEEFGALGQFLFIFGTDVLSLPDFGREVQFPPIYVVPKMGLLLTNNALLRS